MRGGGILLNLIGAWSSHCHFITGVSLAQKNRFSFTPSFITLTPNYVKASFSPNLSLLPASISLFSFFFSFWEFLSNLVEKFLIFLYFFPPFPYSLPLELSPAILSHSSSLCLIMSRSLSFFFFFPALCFLLLLLILCLLLSNRIPLFPTFSFFLSSFYVFLLQPLSSFFRRLSFSFAIPVILSLVLSPSILIDIFFPFV